MMETASKDANRKRGRPVTGNAVSDADRMRAYRARKKAQVLAERLAAGLPPPRPGRLGTRPAKPAVADPGMQAKIAELEAANRKLEDEVSETRRSVAYHLSEIKRLENEKDSRGTSLLKGKEPARKHREASLAEWAASSPWHGRENVKTLRTNVSRAIGTLEELRGIVAKSGAKLGYDADLLAKAMAVLMSYKAGMDNADAHAAHAQREAKKALETREKVNREKVLTKVFGTATPDADMVRVLAADLIAYDAAASDWLKARYRTDSAYSSIQSPFVLRQSLDKPAALLTSLADVLVEMRLNGCIHRDERRNETTWLGGMDDFDRWRAAK